MRKITFTVSIDLYDTYKTFNDTEKRLFITAKKTCLNAYAPYSNFQVGAAVLLENGKIISGNNQENAAYPSGLCAERVALFYAMAQYPHSRPIALAITINYTNKKTDDIIPPCGACRQVIAEYEHKFKQPIKLFLLGRHEKVGIVHATADLLPLLFNSDMLTK